MDTPEDRGIAIEYLLDHPERVREPDWENAHHSEAVSMASCVFIAWLDRYYTT